MLTEETTLAQENGCRDYRASKGKVATTELRWNSIITGTAIKSSQKTQVAHINKLVSILLLIYDLLKVIASEMIVSLLYKREGKRINWFSILLTQIS